MVKMNANKEKATSFVGTPNYIAPELIEKGSYSVEVDWWALGVMLYEMHTNRNLFSGSDEDEMYRNILYKQIFPFKTGRVDSSMTNILMNLLQRKVEERLSWRITQSVQKLVRGSKKLRKLNRRVETIQQA